MTVPHVPPTTSDLGSVPSPEPIAHQAASSRPESLAGSPYNVPTPTPGLQRGEPAQTAPRSLNDADADTADRLLDQYERTVLPSLPPIREGIYTVEFADGQGYVTFGIERSWKYDGAHVAIARADSRNSLSFEGKRFLGTFAIVRGRQSWALRELREADDIPEIQKPVRRLMMGLDAVLRSSDARRYRAVRCDVCDELLTAPDSIKARVGPKCEEYLRGQG